MGFRSFEGEFYADRMNNVYKVIHDGEITEMNSGHPFTYPACVLQQVNGERSVLTIGKSLMDSILTKTVMPQVPDNQMEILKYCMEEFADALSLAGTGKYFDDKKTQERVALISTNLAESFLNRGFVPSTPEEFCHKQTVKFLESFMSYILAHLEIVYKIREKEKAQQEAN